MNWPALIATVAMRRRPRGGFSQKGLDEIERSIFFTLLGVFVLPLLLLAGAMVWFWTHPPIEVTSKVVAVKTEQVGSYKGEVVYRMTVNLESGEELKATFRGRQRPPDIRKGATYTFWYRESSRSIQKWEPS